MDFYGCYFDSNSAGYAGGALIVDQFAYARVTLGMCSGNSAIQGGCIWLSQAALSMDVIGVHLTGNEGLGTCREDDYAQFEDGVCVGVEVLEPPTAERINDWCNRGVGGAIYMDGSRANVHLCIFEGNLVDNVKAGLDIQVQELYVSSAGRDM